MQRQSLFCPRSTFGYAKVPAAVNDSGFVCFIPNQLHGGGRDHIKLWLLRAKIPCIPRSEKLEMIRITCLSETAENNVILDENQEESSEVDDDDELCPAECVREFKSDKEFFKILEKAKETDSLVVVDFYRTSCGSCKYIEQGFAKLCRGSGDQDAAVIFLKHNVIDEYEEQSEVAERLRIKMAEDQPHQFQRQADALFGSNNPYAHMAVGGSSQSIGENVEVGESSAPPADEWPRLRRARSSRPREAEEDVQRRTREARWRRLVEYNQEEASRWRSMQHEKINGLLQRSHFSYPNPAVWISALKIC